MKSILDKDFRYVSSINTDLRKTFARIRYEQSKSVHAPAVGAGVVRRMDDRKRKP